MVDNYQLIIRNNCMYLLYTKDRLKIIFYRKIHLFYLLLILQLLMMLELFLTINQ